MARIGSLSDNLCRATRVVLPWAARVGTSYDASRRLTTITVQLGPVFHSVQIEVHDEEILSLRYVGEACDLLRAKMGDLIDAHNRLCSPPRRTKPAVAAPTALLCAQCGAPLPEPRTCRCEHCSTWHIVTAA